MPINPNPRINVCNACSKNFQVGRTKSINGSDFRLVKTRKYCLDCRPRGYKGKTGGSYRNRNINPDKIPYGKVYDIPDEYFTYAVTNNTKLRKALEALNLPHNTDNEYALKHRMANLNLKFKDNFLEISEIILVENSLTHLSGG